MTTVSPPVLPRCPFSPVSPVAPVLPVLPVAPVVPVLPVLPVLPVAPVAPAGPGTATGTTCVGVTTVALSHALNVSVARTAGPNIEYFMTNAFM